MSHKIAYSLWFNNNAEEALRWYCSIFDSSEIKTVQPVVSEATISGSQFIGINGGEIFHPNPSISFMLTIEDKQTLKKYWDELIVGGKELMALNAYPWSEYYGWVEDKYGVNWQLYLGQLSDVNQQVICPTLMFTQDRNGHCESAINYYSTIFKDFELQGILKHPSNDSMMNGLVQHAQFKILGTTMMAMDGGNGHNFSFNEGVSFVLYCQDQQEIDYYWNQLTREGKESMCGWCIDAYGVHWQIIPYNLPELLKYPNAQEALMKMKKIEIDTFKS